MLFKKKKVYKCVAYINCGEKDNIAEAFEIEEYSEKRAYNAAYEILKLKYPKMGFDIRISTKQNGKIY